jgi:hypothetical protein
MFKKFVRKFVEKINKMGYLEGNGVPVLTYRTQGSYRLTLWRRVTHIWVVPHS